MSKKLIDPVLSERIMEFQDWALYDGKYSLSTIVRDARKIVELSREFDVLNPTEDAIRSYFLFKLKSDAKRQTLNVARKGLQKWIRFLQERHSLRTSIILQKFKEPRTSLDWIPTDDDVRKIIHFADAQNNRHSAARDGAIMRILFSGALRIGEVARINLEDIRENGIFVHSEKGEADTVVALSGDALDHIRRYIDFYWMPTDPKALFTGPNGRLDAEYIRRHISTLGKRAVPQFHPHAARHWVATTLLRGSTELGIERIDIRFVQTHLRHASLASTQVYTHIDPEMNAKLVREQMNKFFLKAEINTGSNEPVPAFTGPRGFEPPTYGLRVHRST